jgi:hypothetical protein
MKQMSEKGECEREGTRGRAREQESLRARERQSEIERVKGVVVTHGIEEEK